MERKRSAELTAAIEVIRKTAEGQLVIDHLERIEKKDVMALVGDEAFRLTDSQGEVRAYKSALELSIEDGTLTKLPFAGNVVVVSAPGYNRWADTSGSVAMPPPSLIGFGGQIVSNPYIVRDDNNRRILCVIARTVAYRFSSKGIPQVSDRTTIFDLPSYRMIDLIAKAKQTPQAFRLLPKEMQPPASQDDPPLTWARYDFDEATSLWVNTAHREALQWYGQIVNREKKAIDFAQTFAQRNALKHLSGLQRVPGDAETWRLPVICWRPTSGNLVKWDMTRYLEVRESAMRLAAGDSTAFELKAGIDYVGENEMSEAGMELDEETVDTGGHVESGSITPDREEEPNGRQSSSRQLAVFAEMEPGIYEQACLECGMTKGANPRQLNDEMARKILGKINAIVDGS